MQSFTTDQKLALLVVPVLLFGLLGVSTASAYGRNLTSEERSAIEEAHDLREAGEYERAQEVLDKAGLIRNTDGARGGFGAQQIHPKRQAIYDAVEANDYEAFKEAVQGLPFEDTVTEDTFALIVEAHALRENGDIGEAHTLLEQAGVAVPLGFGNGMGNGHHKHGNF